MKSTVRTYAGDGFEVSFDVRRCIHAESCVHGLPKVFDRDQTPWIDARQGSAAEIAAVIYRCPTGALGFRREGKVVEPPPARNRIRVTADGPFYAEGDIELVDHDGNVLLRESRIAFCRCGLSNNKPLCDDAHYDGKFADPGAMGDSGTLSEHAPIGPLRITARNNGPLRFEGAVEVETTDGQRVVKEKGSLCRCGQSQNKPFCDGTHKRIAFSTAE